MGSNEALKLINYIQDALAEQEYLDYLKTKTTDDKEESSSSSEDDHDGVNAQAVTPVDHLPPIKAHDEPATAAAAASAHKGTEPPTQLIKQRKIKRSIQRLQQAKLKVQLHKDSVYQPPKIQPEAPKSLQIKFISAQVKREYEAWPEKETTLKDILGDIYLNPWGTSGKGKPEILRHKIMGVRGCISRRINGEDRLIYKATGPNEITIFAVGGHYNF